jgi:hypothetical protein
VPPRALSFFSHAEHSLCPSRTPFSRRTTATPARHVVSLTNPRAF